MGKRAVRLTHPTPCAVCGSRDAPYFFALPAAEPHGYFCAFHAECHPATQAVNARMLQAALKD